MEEKALNAGDGPSESNDAVGLDKVSVHCLNRYRGSEIAYAAGIEVAPSASISTEAGMPVEGLLYTAMVGSCEKGVFPAGASSIFRSKGVHVVIGSANACKTWRHKSRADPGSLMSSRAIPLDTLMVARGCSCTISLPMILKSWPCAFADCDQLIWSTARMQAGNVGKQASRAP